LVVNMNPEEKETEYLFSYGTLRDEDVQLATFGRRLAGEPDALVGYRLRMVRIQDQQFVALSGSEHHRSICPTGVASDVVEGAAFALTRGELRRADAYEPAGYERMPVRLKSGRSAWVYVNTS
jgi:hypothetical protein